MNSKHWITRLVTAASIGAPLQAGALIATTLNGCKHDAGSEERFEPHRGPPQPDRPYRQICIPWPAPVVASKETGCPEDEVAKKHFPPTIAADWEFKGQPKRVDEQCCYQAHERAPTIGRPFSTPIFASLVAGSVERTDWRDVKRLPDVSRLSPDQREDLQLAWTHDALLEHASIAAFGRVALELMGFGAPAYLIARTQRAALEEVNHARLCFALASAYAGHPVGPGKLDLGTAVILECDLLEFVVRTIREGCVGETIAAIIAAEQLEHARDPAVKSALATIARDEAGHAELAWATVGWAIRNGLQDRLDDIRDAFADVIIAVSSPASTAVHQHILLEHGRLDGDVLHQLTTSALRDVIEPSVTALATWPTTLPA